MNPFRRRPKPLTLRDAKRIRLGPDDTLVILTDQRLSRDIANRISHDLSKHFDGRPVLVFDKDMDIAVIESTSLSVKSDQEMPDESTRKPRPSDQPRR